MQASGAAFGLSALVLASLAACGGGDPALTSEARTAHPLSAARAIAATDSAPTGDVFAATTYDPSTPDRVTVGSIVVGDTRYNNVLASFSQLVGSLSTGAATRSYDSYDGSTGHLTVASVTVGGTTYTNVVVAVRDVLSVGSSRPVAPVIPNDPLFGDQWHLRNTGQAGPDGVPGKAGEDLNVTMAWNYATGTGIRIAIVDDGLDIHHEDLRVVPGLSWDYRFDRYGDPSSSESSHGTAVAGLAAARGNNGIGVAGVAFNAQLVGYNLLAASTEEYGSDAMVKGLTENHIYSNSYGATDSNGLYALGDDLWQDAIEAGLRIGRGGKGAIYTWAAGNGAPEDRSDYDGQANYHGVLAIGSLNDQGQRSSYSEPGSNLLVMAFGGEQCDTHTMTTVDVTGAAGYNHGTGANTPEDPYVDYAGQANYTRCMNGTSAATPEATGVIALMLEANPTLGWRDVRAILAKTARKNDPSDPDWRVNGAGLHINHNYGFGAIDARAAVEAARNWALLPAQQTADSIGANMSIAVPDGGAAMTARLVLNGTGIRKVEFVALAIISDHPEVGELEITLTSPSGTVSTVSLPRDCKDEQAEIVPCGNGLAEGFRFGIVRLMDEPADGSWVLSIRDDYPGNAGALNGWAMRVYGH